MSVIRKTALEVLLLGVLGVSVAFAANGVRGQGLNPLENYFRKAPVNLPEKAPVGVSALGTNGERFAAEERARPASAAARVSAPAAGAASAAPAKKHLEHPYQEIDLAGVVALHNDPNTLAGLNIFVDARNDEAYEAGHIPGAVQCDHYRLDRYIDNVMQFASAADKIVVYCNGGQCEDSIFMCTNLYERGIDFDRIYLFAGGWKEWEQSGQPVERGLGE